MAVPLPNGDLHVYSGGQGVWDDRNQIASVLGMDPSRITVELVSNGGAFGGKEDMANQAQTALAAHLLGRSVKCTLTREQSLHIHPKRHPIRIELWAGCDSEGRLTAFKARMLGDSGPYASVGMKVLERAAGHASGALCGGGHRCGSLGGAHQQLGVWCFPRIRRQPGAIRHGRGDGPPG